MFKVKLHVKVKHKLATHSSLPSFYTNVFLFYTLAAFFNGESIISIVRELYASAFSGVCVILRRYPASICHFVEGAVKGDR